MLEKFVVYTVLAANGVGVANNYVFAADPAKWLHPVPIATSPTSAALFSLQFQAPATVTMVTTNVSSRA